MGWGSSPGAVQGHCYLPLSKTEDSQQENALGGVVVMKERPGVCFQVCRLGEDSVAAVLCTDFSSFTVDGV